MRRGGQIVRIGAVAAVFGGAVFLSSAAQAQTQAAADPVSFWWFHGTIEAGGRAFLNNPQRNGSAYLGQDSLAKYYEYSSPLPGALANIELATGSKDGLYQIDFGGKNIGYSDQNYYLDMSKAGEHYLSLGFDQSPHLYSTSAQTPYRGIGSNALTLPPGLASVANVSSAVIIPFLQPTDIGIKRDTTSIEYRWTPDDAWDIKADLSHLRRTGTQVDGIVGMGPTSGFNPTQVPMPVSDTTQNFGLNGEYVGSSIWGQRYNFKLAYKGSQYTDDFSSYTAESPYCTGNLCGGAPNPLSPFVQYSLPPSNQANAFSGTLGADLPWKSRYAGTMSYTMMRQDTSFIPMTNNPNALPAVNVLPASSLNGAINTLLSNNVLTSQITPDLKSKLTYRYYDFQNNTPEILFPSWVSYDRTLASETAISSLSMAYTKQNAGADLNWRPSHEWNLGVAYGYERYNWTRADADVTNENSGKVFADWKPATWLTVRSSGYYANRRYDNYNYLDFVGNIQFPTTTPATNRFFYSNSYQQMMLDNRERWKANFAFDMVVMRGVMITPNFKYQDDSYGVDPQSQMGLSNSRSWNWGLDITYLVNPDTSIMIGYLRENYTQLLYGITSTDNQAVPGGPGIVSAQTNDRITVDTFTALVKYVVIPNQLDTDLRYTLSRGVDHQLLNLGDGTAPSGGQFPDMTTWFQRLDATATYKLDPALVAQLGWTGEVKAKLHYAWERNSVSNWANDPLAPYSPTVSTTAIWLASDNPNYNVHVITASLAWKW